MIQGLTDTQREVLSLLRAGSVVHVGDNYDADGLCVHVTQDLLDLLARNGLIELDHNNRALAVAVRKAQLP